MKVKTIAGILLVLGLVLVFSGCTEQGSTEEELESCEQYEGADMCTEEYDPVCGKIEGTGGEVQWETFSNACHACISEKNVVGYKEGACE